MRTRERVQPVRSPQKRTRPGERGRGSRLLGRQCADGLHAEVKSHEGSNTQLRCRKGSPCGVLSPARYASAPRPGFQFGGERRMLPPPALDLSGSTRTRTPAYDEDLEGQVGIHAPLSPRKAMCHHAKEEGRAGG